MAISYLNSQGTKLFVLDTAQKDAVEAAGTTAAELALIIEGTGTDSYLVGCPQSIGNIEETRAVTEYKCMSSDESAKALGSISRGNIEIGLLFDPTDTLGQDQLKEAFQLNAQIGIGIELPDEDLTLGSGGTPSGTTFYFTGGVSAVSVGIEQDAAVTYTVTIEIGSDVTEYDMVAGTA